MTAIATNLTATVDLTSPGISLLLRGVDVGGVYHCALALEIASDGECHAPLSGAVKWDHGDDVASEGRPYFVRDAHGKPPPRANSEEGLRSTDTRSKAAIDENALPALLQRIEVALAAAAVCEIQDADHGGSADGSGGGQKQAVAALGKAKWRRTRAAGGARATGGTNAVQAEALSLAIAEAGLLRAPSTQSDHPRATNEPPLAAGQTNEPPLAAGQTIAMTSAQRPLWTVEFGAGAGELSRRIAADAVTLPSGPLEGQMLLDRSCGRGGQRCSTVGEDRWEEGDPRLLSGRTLRLRIDIRHLYLPGVEELRGAAVTAVGKHVCGAATDLMLRCMVAPAGHNPDAAGVECSPCHEELECRGIGVALCCHHLCNWDDYVNRGFVTRAGLTPADFGAVCRLSCWATTHRNATGDPARQRVGMTCKAFLDAGRCLYLRERGFDARLAAYCSSEETPENRLLIAKRVKEPVVVV